MTAAVANKAPAPSPIDSIMHGDDQDMEYKFKLYVQLQNEGKFNMFELPHRRPDVYSKDDFLYIISNYESLYTKYCKNKLDSELLARHLFKEHKESEAKTKGSCESKVIVIESDPEGDSESESEGPPTKKRRPCTGSEVKSVFDEETQPFQDPCEANSVFDEETQPFQDPCEVKSVFDEEGEDNSDGLADHWLRYSQYVEGEIRNHRIGQEQMLQVMKQLKYHMSEERKYVPKPKAKNASERNGGLVQIVTRKECYDFDVRSEHDIKKMTEKSQGPNTTKNITRCSVETCPCWFDSKKEWGFKFCGLHYECKCGCGAPVEQYGKDYCNYCLDKAKNASERNGGLVQIVTRKSCYDSDVSEHDIKRMTEKSQGPTTTKNITRCSVETCPCWFDSEKEEEYEFCGLHYKCECGAPVEQYGEDCCNYCLDEC